MYSQVDIVFICFSTVNGGGLISVKETVRSPATKLYEITCNS